MRDNRSSSSASLPPSGNLEDLPEGGFGQQLKTLGFLIPYLWPKDNVVFKLRIIGAIIVTVAAQFAISAAPIAVEVTINRLAAGEFGAAVAWSAIGLIIGYGGVRMLGALLPQLREVLFTRVGQNAQRRVAVETFAHIHKLSLRFHLERRTGGLSRIIERGVKSIDFLFRFLLFNIGPTFVQLLIVSSIIALRYDPLYAAIAAATVFTYVWFTVASTEWRLKFRREMNRQDTDANTKSVDSLLNYETVKYFNNEGFESRRFDSAMGRYQDAAVRSNLSLSAVNVGQAFIFNVGLMVILSLSAWEIAHGRMEVGVFSALLLMMMNLNQPLNILSFAYREIKQSLVDMEKMFSLLQIDAEVKDKPGAPPLAVEGGEVVFDNVEFCYEPNRKILKGVSFTAKAGEKIAIVGHSGAGKSTVSRILYRFYDISGGRVLVDGQDIRDVGQDSLRRAIGIVPQDTVLFNDTIAYNIAYAAPGASDADIRKAARLARIDSFIDTLPDGYDTLVGERGLKLSGGEKQRVAIARTILKDPPILVLDEATSALDTTTEQEIQSSLAAVAKNRTTLIIAHRLSTIIDADQIIVLREGEIAEQGAHAELLKKGGEYADLWARQQSGADAVAAAQTADVAPA